MSKMGISAVSQLPGRADLRGGRHRSGGHRQLLHRHGVARARRRHAARSPRRRWRGTRARSAARPERELDVGGQHTVARHRRGAPVDAEDGRQAAGGGAARRRRELRRVRAAHQRSDAAPHDAARDVGPRSRSGPRCRSRGRAGGVDRQALHHRRDVVRVDLARGAREPRDRDEPHRRQVEHRRGRRGSGALRPDAQRRLAPLGDQAGGLGALRRDRASTWSTPTTSRSRWPRAPSPAKAASSPGTRSTRSSRACATRRRA